MSSTELSARGFWRTVTKGVRRTARDCGWQLGDNLERGYAFQRWVAEVILSAEPGLTMEPERAMLCSEDLNVDLIFEDAVAARLLLVRTKYQARGRTITEHPVSVFFGRHDKYMSHEWVLSRGTGTAAETLADYKEKVDKGYSIAYYFISTGYAPPRLLDLAKSCSDGYAEQGLNITCEVLDFDRLKEYYGRCLLARAPLLSEKSIDVADKPGLFERISTAVDRNALGDIWRHWRDSRHAWNIKKHLKTEKDTTVFALATVIAVVAVLAIVVLQLSHNKTQVQLKKYEITYAGIGKGYEALLEAFTDLRSSPGTSSPSDFSDRMRRIEARYFAVEPFLNEKTRAELWNLLQSYIEESRQARINSDVPRQKKNGKQDERTRSARPSDDQEELFLAYRAKLRDLFLKTMSEMR
jgi:hypothetical protein